MKTNNYGMLHTGKKLQGAMTQKIYGNQLHKINSRATQATHPHCPNCTGMLPVL